MSLQHAAQHLAAQGRFGDSHLVHMSTGEIRGLQDLARLHGKSMTVNPHTGLPEAFSLKSLLPALIGGAISAYTGLPPSVVGLGMGAFETMRTGSIEKGLSAGLGAYGGSSLAGGLSAIGNADIGKAAAEAADPVGSPEQGWAENLAVEQAKAANPFSSISAGLDKVVENPKTLMDTMGKKGLAMAAGAAAAPVIAQTMNQTKPNVTPYQPDKDMGQRYVFNPSDQTLTKTPYDMQMPMPDIPRGNMTGLYGRGRRYVNPTFTRISAEDAKNYYGYADGGPLEERVPTDRMPVEKMSDANSVGANTGYPTSDIPQGGYATPWETPISRNVVADSSDANVNMFTGEPRGMATGGISDLGSYSDGGRLLRGPGDGVSDSIPAVVGKKQPARLADGEFVVPARIVSELGNGSTEAGARKLYAMMDRVQKARGKTVGKDRVARNTRSEKYLPA